MSRRLHERYAAFRGALQKQKRILVAFSGGCDSAFLLAAAVKMLGVENVLAVTAVSASLAEKEKNSAQRIATLVGARHREIETRELQNASYAANPSNRCFFCKDELFETLNPIAQENEMILADGFNASDRTDFRPGYQASQKWNVLHPMNDSDLYKKDIRALSRWMGLPTWSKPASPCLSSRIPYGTPVMETILKKIEKAEEIVRAEGFSIVRVRHYGDEARIEVPLDDISRLKSGECRERVMQGVIAAGYSRVTVDPRGFESGRLNQNALTLEIKDL